MATIPGVSDDELIRTSWGDAVADELNSNVVKKTGADQVMTAALSAPLYLSAAQSSSANAVTRKDYVDGQNVAYNNAANARMDSQDQAYYAILHAEVETRLYRNGDTVNGTLTWNGDPYAGNHGTAVQAAAIAVNTHVPGNSNLWLMHSGDAYTSGGLYAGFCGQTGGAIVGAVIQSGGSVSYFAASDYRLKDELGPVDDPVGRLMALQPKRLRWKEGGRSSTASSPTKCKRSPPTP